MPKRKLMSVSMYAASAVLAFFSLFAVVHPAWPELSDTDKPVLELEGIEDGGAYRGLISVTFTVKDETTAVGRVSIRVDETDVYDREIGRRSWFDGASIDTSTLSEGEHRLTLAVTDRSLWRQRREVAVSFRIDRTPPRLSVRPFTDSVPPGGTGGLVIVVDEAPSSLSVDAPGETVACYPLPGRQNAFRALFGVSQFAAPGVLEIRCVARDRAGNETTEPVALRVLSKKFAFETIAVPTHKRGILRDTARKHNDRELIAEALSARGGTQLWRGTFIRPAPGIDSSPFGIRRVYESGGAVSSHQGIDIANKEGTPIVASNSGVVLFAGELFVTGNTVILDHGQGVVSYYFHMNELVVKKGDAVARGAPLGAMGTTGLSTGSHCHWEIKVGERSVNPDDWRRVSFEPTDEMMLN